MVGLKLEIQNYPMPALVIDHGEQKPTITDRLQIQGRDGVFSAIVEPGRSEALIGAIVLEDLDFLVDCAQQKLIPRDPTYIVSEIE